MCCVRRHVLILTGTLMLSRATLPQATLPSQSGTATGNQEPMPTLRAETDLVLVDVAVTQNGQPVHGLDKSRFEIFEDGKQEKIATFDEISAPNPSQADSSAFVLPPNTYSNIPRYPVADAVDVILLDTLNTAVLDRSYAERQLLTFLTHARPGTMIAIYSLGTKLNLEANFTSDPAALLQMKQEKPGSPQPTLAYEEETNKRRMNELNKAPAAVKQSLVESLKEDEARFTAEETGTRIRMTLQAMQQLAETLRAVPGRKNLIWISGSFPLALAPDTELKNPFAAESAFGPALASTARKLAAARVAVYAIDARGLLGLPSANATVSYSDNGGAVLPDGTVKIAGDSDNTKFLNSIADTHGSMRALAHASGGEAYLNTNGIAQAIASAVNDGENYYTLGYAPSHAMGDGRFHKIRVNIPGTDFELSYREGYLPDLAASMEQQAQGSLSFAMLHGAPPSRQIAFEARVFPVTDHETAATSDPVNAGDMINVIKGPKKLYAADLVVDIRPVGFALGRSGIRTGSLEFGLAAFRRDGAPINHVYSHATLQLHASQLADALRRGVALRMEVYLPPGYCFLRLAVRDAATGRVGSLEIPTQVD